MKEEPSSIETEVQDLLRRFKANHKQLYVVYQEEGRWARHFNTLIWTTGAIFVPISFVGLAFDFSNSDKIIEDTGKLINPMRVLYAAFVSISMLIFWNCLCEWHRKLWVRNSALTNIIQFMWGYRDEPGDMSKMYNKPSSHLLTKMIAKDWGRSLRQGIVTFGVLLWITRTFLAFSVDL